MSDRVLRMMYTGMVRGRAKVQGLRGGQTKAAWADVACFAACLVGTIGSDVAFGCRDDGVMQAIRPASQARVADGVGRLYAAAGAAMTFRKVSAAAVVVFFEAHEVSGPGWREALRVGAELPLVLVVLPRWKGRDTGDLCAASRKAGVPGIAVDAADAVALYRVAQESTVRARMGGGAALIEAVWFQPADEPAADAVEGLSTYLRMRGVASRRWLDRVS